MDGRTMTDDEIRSFISKKYKTLKSDSLIFEKLFEVGKEVRDRVEMEYDNFYNDRIMRQDAEIRHLKGLPPIARA